MIANSDRKPESFFQRMQKILVYTHYFD